MSFVGCDGGILIGIVENVKIKHPSGKVKKIYRNGNRNQESHEKVNHRTGGIFMREVIEEYAGAAAGGVAAIVILGMTVEFVLGDAGLYEIILNFARSIC